MEEQNRLLPEGSRSGSGTVSRAIYPVCRLALPAGYQPEADYGHTCTLSAEQRSGSEAFILNALFSSGAFPSPPSTSSGRCSG